MNDTSLDGRENYKVFRPIQTRWADNDVYGHVNNVVYYAWFDTAVNGWLIDQGMLDITNAAVIGIVVETGCRYLRSIAFPSAVTAGLRSAHIGRSSVRYEIALFTDGHAEPAATGFFVHVYVDRQTMRPIDMPEALRLAVGSIATG